MKSHKRGGAAYAAAEPEKERMIPEQRLANAVVLQAVEDYRRAIRFLKNFPKDQEAERSRKEVEAFFNSEIFHIYCDIDGSGIARQIRADESKRAQGFYNMWWKRGKIR